MWHRKVQACVRGSQFTFKHVWSSACEEARPGDCVQAVARGGNTRRAAEKKQEESFAAVNLFPLHRERLILNMLLDLQHVRWWSGSRAALHSAAITIAALNDSVLERKLPSCFLDRKPPKSRSMTDVQEWKLAVGMFFTLTLCFVQWMPFTGDCQSI